MIGNTQGMGQRMKPYHPRPSTGGAEQTIERREVGKYPILSRNHQPLPREAIQKKLPATTLRHYPKYAPSPEEIRHNPTAEEFDRVTFSYLNQSWHSENMLDPYKHLAIGFNR